ncbi:hypothetical protein GCM10007387_41240 [Pseudoduganella albidiflava]|nr:hypothetical protein GCM10007387_41240 [Pseudoduganella albidiflava]
MWKVLCAGALLTSSAALALGAQPWAFEYRPFKGSYQIYGGSLGDTIRPTNRSRNIQYNVKGPVARQMFDSMGPDLKNVCGADDEQRLRQRADVACTFSAKNGYSCTFGFDLVTGRSIAGSIC